MKNQKELYQIRKELVFINSMMTSLSTNLPKQFFESTDFFSNDLLLYFNDVQDHILNVKTRVLISIENVRNILDLYMNTISTKMNHIMTVLTIFSAIFIPLSFLAGVFGMNFVNFAILQNTNGILFFIALCVIISGSMLAFFKWKKWF
jgi:magnesium transporter